MVSLERARLGSRPNGIRILCTWQGVSSDSNRPRALPRHASTISCSQKRYLLVFITTRINDNLSFELAALWKGFISVPGVGQHFVIPFVENEFHASQFSLYELSLLMLSPVFSGTLGLCRRSGLS